MAPDPDTPLGTTAATAADASCLRHSATSMTCTAARGVLISKLAAPAAEAPYTQLRSVSQSGRAPAIRVHLRQPHLVPKDLFRRVAVRARRALWGGPTGAV